MAYYPMNVRLTSLASGVGTSDVDLPVEDGASYPDPTAPGRAPYKVLVGFGTDREETCLVTAKPTADTLRVTRGYDTSPATSKNAGDFVVPAANAADLAYFAAKVDRSGDTMTGALVLPGDPSTALQAAPKQYVDAAAPTVTRNGTRPPTPKADDIYITDTNGLTDLAPADVLTNTARWGWAALGFNAGTSFVAEAGGMRVNFAAGVDNIFPGMFVAMTGGRTYRLEVLVDVPVGSNPVVISNALVHSGGSAPAGATTRLYLDVPMSTSGSVWLGVIGDGTVSGGSVLIKEFHVYDATEDLPRFEVFDPVHGWTLLRDGAAGRMYVSRGGGQMSGPLLLHGDPAAALGAATRQYVDNLIGGLLNGATSYTPALSGAGWSLGNGTIQGLYWTLGDIALLEVRLTLGSLTVVGSQSPVFSVPFTILRTFASRVILNDAGNNAAIGAASVASTSVAAFTTVSPGNWFTHITPTNPFTWQAGDSIIMSIICQKG